MSIGPGARAIGRGFPIWLSPAERLRALLAYAVLAPSRHNSQPWLFDVAGPEVLVVADRRRALPHTDPAGRQRVMACGAALENLCIAAAAYGHATSVEVLAGARADGVLARVRLEEPREPTADDEALFAAMARRRTSRVAFEERGAPAGLVAALVREAAARGCALRPVEEGGRAGVAALVVEADRVQWSDPGFVSEHLAWMPPESLLDRVLVRVRVQGRAAEEERRDRQYALHGPVLLALSSSGDAARDWLAAGRAFQRVLLHAACAGMAASCFSAAIEVADVRSRLRAALGESGWLQLLFRLGYSSEPMAATPRRGVDEVLRYYGNDAPSQALAPRP